MANYSDFTLNSGEYVPQYAGSPIDDIQQTSQVLQNRHYENIAEASVLELALKQMQSKALPGAKEYLATHVGQVSAELENLAQNGAENSTAKVLALKNRMLGDQGILAVGQRATEYDKFLEAKARQKDPVYDKNKEKALLAASVVNPETGELSPEYASKFDLNSEERLDYLAKKDEIVAPIRSDISETDLAKAMEIEKKKKLGNRITDLEFFKTQTVEKLTREKVRNYIDKEGGWENYKASSEYLQEKQFGGKDGGPKSDAEIKADLLSRGYAKAFSSQHNDYIKNSSFGTTPAGATTDPNADLTVPVPAAIRVQDQEKNYDPDNITKEGVKKTFWDKSLEVLTLYGAEAVNDIKLLDLNMTEEDLKKAQNINKDITQKKMTLFYGKGDQIDAAKTTQAVKDFRVVMDVAGYSKPGLGIGLGGKHSAANAKGSTASGMTDKEILALASSREGQKMIQDYKAAYEGIRYNFPINEIPVDEQVRQANEDFTRGTFDNRQIIDPATGELYTSMRDENGKTRADLEDLHQALIKKTAIYTGRFTPQNLYTQTGTGSRNFTRAIRVMVPNEDGKQSKEYILSELPTLTSQADFNENILWNKATVQPGAEQTVAKGIKVQNLVTAAQKENEWARNGAKWALDHGLTKDQFMSGQGVMLTINGETLPFGSYTAAAQYLTEQGISLEK